ncbi:MAG: 3-keto-5-aminohexanoate cleavage protein [Woeseiaceae bacterium]|nr:3-keto-5-aminohexanoate cleavage protein [Woeseiaceae bacterium]
MPFIIMSAPNGARRGKQDHPALPITPAELAECAEQIVEAGAAMIHLHVRDESGRHSLDPDRYRQAIAAIRERVGEQLIIQVTTEACSIYTPQQQMSVVRQLRPEAVTLALKELCPDAAAEKSAAAFFTWLDDEDVMAQYILYSDEDVVRFTDLRTRGVIPDAWPFVLLVLGRYSDSLTGDPSLIDGYVRGLEQDVAWMVCCFGETESAAVAEAARLHGHARVGFENNLLLPDGSPAPDNAALIRVAAETARTSARRVANADDVREMLA